MLDSAWARRFAREWIDAWNAGDLEKILAHCAEDFEMSSPLVLERLGAPDGKVRGKPALRAYWQPSLAMRPALRLELIDVLAGVDSVTLYYRNVGRRVVAETLWFDAAGRALRGAVHWSVSAQD
jgi:hypothetical protein